MSAAVGNVPVQAKPVAAPPAPAVGPAPAALPAMPLPAVPGLPAAAPPAPPLCAPPEPLPATAAGFPESLLLQAAIAPTVISATPRPEYRNFRLVIFKPPSPSGLT